MVSVSPGAWYVTAVDLIDSELDSGLSSATSVQYLIDAFLHRASPIARSGDFVRGAFETLAQYEVHWEERRVVPLAPDAASMTGTISFTGTTQSDEVATGRVVSLNVFVKRGEAWKLLHTQNMTLTPPETE